MGELETIYKSVIKKKGLVESGKFYHSIKIKVVHTKKEIIFDITGVDYGIYLQEDIIDDFVNHKDFQDVFLNILLEPFNDVDNVLEGKVSFVQRLFIRYNKKTVFDLRV